MRDHVYLVIGRRGVRRMTKTRPSLKADEVAVELNVAMPDRAFERFLPSVTVAVPDIEPPAVEIHAHDARGPGGGHGTTKASGCTPTVEAHELPGSKPGPRTKRARNRPEDAQDGRGRVEGDDGAADAPSASDGPLWPPSIYARRRMHDAYRPAPSGEPPIATLFETPMPPIRDPEASE